MLLSRVGSSLSVLEKNKTFIRSCPGSQSESFSSCKNVLSVLGGIPAPSLDDDAATPTKKLPISLQKQIRKTKICLHNLTGRCNRGDACSFAHSEEELKSVPDLYKTRLCEKYIKTGFCPYMHTCRFAHGDSELRSTPEFFKTSICPYYQSKLVCPAGDKCRWAHGNKEIRPRVYPIKPDETAFLNLSKDTESPLKKSGPTSCNEDRFVHSDKNSPTEPPERMDAKENIWFSEICRSLITRNTSVASALCKMDTDSLRKFTTKVLSEPNLLALYAKSLQQPSLVEDSEVNKQPIIASDPWKLNPVKDHGENTKLARPESRVSISFDGSISDLNNATHLQQQVDSLRSPDFQYPMNTPATMSDPTLVDWISTSTERDEEPVDTLDAYLVYSANLDTWLDSEHSNKTAAFQPILNAPFNSNTSSETIMTQLILSNPESTKPHPLPFEKMTSSHFSTANVDLLGCNF